MRLGLKWLPFALLLMASPAWAETPAGYHQTLLPKRDLWSPLLADPNEPRFYLAYRRLRMEEGSLPGIRPGAARNTADVGAGGLFTVIGYENEKGNGAQFGISAAVISQFNFDTSSVDLLNTDYFVALPAVYRRGRFTSRLRVYHQSSHVGDESLIHNRGTQSPGFGIEIADVLFGWESPLFRVYGGGGWVLHSEPKIGRGIVQLGVEFRARKGPGLTFEKNKLGPIAALDSRWSDLPGHKPVFNAVAGLELSGVQAADRTLRFLGTLGAGTYPHGQRYYQQEARSIGFEIQFLM